MLHLDDLMDRAANQKRASWVDIPARPGVYVVCLPNGMIPSFTAHAGLAIHAIPEDPRVLQGRRDSILQHGPTGILYIGKGSGRKGLRQRVRQLVRFGVGRATNHGGGEWLWQVEQIRCAQLLMRCCSVGWAEGLESELLARFKKDHGSWPLANRNRGTRSRSRLSA